MKSLIFHCKEYKSSFVKLADRPKKIEPEEVKKDGITNSNCIAVFICVEEGDSIENQVLPLIEEIRKIAKDLGRYNIQITPFAHLSNKLASSKEAMAALNLIEEKLQQDFEVLRDHFGSHKTLLLDVFGHAGNVRFREF